jgi:hypothetical protein
MPLPSSRSGLSRSGARLLKFGWRRGKVRGACFFPPEESAPPPDFAASIVQGEGYGLSRELASAYSGDLIQRMVGHTVEIALAGPWNRRARSSAIRGWLRNGLASRLSRPECSWPSGKLRALHYAGDRMGW